MNIRDLIDNLEDMVVQCGENQVVEIWCPEGEDWFPITGFTYGGGENIVRIYNDEA
jgi:hypothetical protein